jgi:hypothetical protein
MKKLLHVLILTAFFFSGFNHYSVIAQEHFLNQKKERVSETNYTVSQAVNKKELSAHNSVSTVKEAQSQILFLFGSNTPKLASDFRM